MDMEKKAGGLSRNIEILLTESMFVKEKKNGTIKKPDSKFM